MQRTKRMVAAVVAAMALVAIAGAPSAFAGYFSVSAGTTNYTATSTSQQFTQPTGAYGSCSTGGNLTGTVANGNKSTAGSAESMSCSSTAEGAVTWNWNGCKVNLAPGNDGSPLNGTFSLSGCGSVEVNSSICEKRIAPQSGTATFANEGGSVATEVTATLSYTVVKSTPYCKNGTLTYTGKWKVNPASGALQALSGKVGISLAGGLFSAETPAYPVNVSGAQDAADQHSIGLPGPRSLKCASANLAGQLSGPSSSIGLAPSYSGCAAYVGASELPAVVNPGSCSYQVAAAKTLGVACGSEGDAIKITLYANATKQAEGVSLCVYNIAPQSGAGGIALSNFGSGSEAGIELGFGGAKLVNTRVSGTAGNCGEKTTNATYQGSTDLSGVMG